MVCVHRPSHDHPRGAWVLLLAVLILAALALLAACTPNAPAEPAAQTLQPVTAAIADRQRSKLSELELARARWKARSFSSYHLTIQLQPYGDSVCEKAVEVNEGAQIKALSDTCSGRYDSYVLKSLGSRTSVPGLFDYIQAEIGRVGECGPNGCACDGGRTIDVVYDTDLGHPKRVEERFEKDWPIKESAQVCSAIGWSSPSPFTVSVNPIE